MRKVDSAPQMDRHAPPSIVPPGNWPQMRVIDARSVNALLPAGARTVDWVADVVKNQSGRDGAVLSLPSENVSTDLRSCPDTELAVTLHQVISPEDAIGILTRFRFSIESLICACVGVVLDRRIHRQSENMPTSVRLAEPASVMISTATENRTFSLHGTEGITLLNLDKEHAP